MINGLHSRCWRTIALAIIILLALGALPGVVGTRTVSAQADELSQREFEDLIDEAQQDDPVFGPEDGDLEHDPELVTLSYADVEVADFLATAVFSNPFADSRDQFDYGIQFRIFDEDGTAFYLRFIVVSSLDWAITTNDGDIVVQGVYEDLDISRRGENELAVYAEGDLVHLGINGDYVGSTNVDLEDPGDIAVGTAFFGDSFQEDAASEFFEFTIWELGGGGNDRDDSPLGRRDDDPTPDEDVTVTEETGEDPTVTEESTPNDDEASPTAESTSDDDNASPTRESTPDNDASPTEGASPTVESTSDSETTTPVDGTQYESPTFGFTLVFDDTWEMTNESTEDQLDLLEISNGPSSIQFLGFETDETPTECVDGIIAGLEGNESVASVEIALDENDEELRGDGDTEAYVVLNVTYISESGDEVDFGAYYTCMRLVEGESMLQVTHLAEIDEYNDEIEHRAAVLETLELDPDGGSNDDPTPSDDDVTPAADDSTPTDDLPEGSVAIYLGAQTSANTSVIGTVAPEGDGSEIALFVLLREADSDYVVTINSGSCTSPGAIEYEVGSVDADGLLDETVDATVEELTNGDYIMVLSLDGAAGEAVSCANLADLAE